MSSTSKKHRSFCSEPIKGKPASALPGVGKAIAQKLESNGYSTAESVLGQYLLLGQNQERFQSWMKEKSNANIKQTGDCYRALKDWSKQFM